MYNWSYVWKLSCKCYIRPKMFKKIKLELIEDCPGWFPQCWKVFAVLWGETPSMALPRDDYWMPRYWPAWQGIVRCSKAAWRLWGQPTIFWLIWGLFHKRQFMPGVTNGSGGHRPDGTACHCFAERTCCQAALWPTNLYPLISACLSLLSIAVMGQWPKATWE